MILLVIIWSHINSMSVLLLKSQSLFSSHTQTQFIDFDQSSKEAYFPRLSGVRETCSSFKIQQNVH